jgi:hypothetical protein
MKKLIALILLIPSALLAQGTTVMPKTTILTNTTVLPYTSPGPALVGSVGTGGNYNTAIASIATGAGGGTAFSCAAGNAAVVQLYSTASVSGTASDSASNSGWTTVANTGASAVWIQSFYNLNLTSSITSATVSFTSTTVTTNVYAYCISGLTGHLDSNFPVSVNGSGVWTTAAAVSTAYSTTGTKEIVVSMIATQNDDYCTSATSPAIIGSVYSDAYTPTSGLYTIYSSTQSGVTQGCTLSGTPAGGGYMQLIGLY